MSRYILLRVGWTRYVKGGARHFLALDPFSWFKVTLVSSRLRFTSRFSMQYVFNSHHSWKVLSKSVLRDFKRDMMLQALQAPQYIYTWLRYSAVHEVAVQAWFPERSLLSPCLSSPSFGPRIFLIVSAFGGRQPKTKVENLRI